MWAYAFYFIFEKNLIMAENQHLSGVIRKEQIKKAVLDIVFSEGLKKLSTKNLAKKVGLSEGAIFRHFPNKQAITLSIIEDVKNDLVHKLELISKRKSSPEKRLEKYICTHISYLIKNKGITIVLFTEASYQNDLKLKKQLEEIFSCQKLFFADIVREGINAGIWNPDISIENLSSLYMGIPVSMNIEMILNGEDFDYMQFCKEMLKLILRALSL